MEGTSHPAHRRPVASERQGTVSNMHLKGKYRGICQSHLYVPNLLPAGGAMSMTEH